MDYDLLVIGGGPAGGTSALYSANSGRSVAVLTGSPGGSSISGVPEIENFPGILRLDGPGFLENLHRQNRSAGVSLVESEARSVTIENRFKVVHDDRGQALRGRALIIATGTAPVIPPIPGVGKLLGRGVSVCPWCDGALFRGRDVAVLGGGNAAYASVLILERFCRGVTLLLPKREGVSFAALRARVASIPRVKVLSGVEVVSVEGDDRLTRVNLVVDGSSLGLQADALFLALGQSPRTSFLGKLVDLGSGGFVNADSRGRTSVPGIFAAGDVVEGVFRQLAVACGSGATAALSAEEYLSRQWG